MNVAETTALITGGASGLGESVVRAVTGRGGKAAILDVNEAQGAKLAGELGSGTIFCKVDVTSEDDVARAIERAIAVFGRITAVVNVAGVAPFGKTIGKKGPLELRQFEQAVKINLIGTFNVIRLAAMKMSENAPTSDGERGVIISTASIAAYDGQIGQAAYAASKGGIVSMTLPIARELSAHGIRNITIAPGIFDTPMMATFSEEIRTNLGKSVPFPQRLGRPDEFARLVLHIIENQMINGETIRLDGALRMPPK